MLRSLIFASLSLCYFFVYAQFGQGMTLDKIKSIYIQEADSQGVRRESIPFAKLTSTKYYYDRKLLQKIQAAKDTTRLHQQLLSKYVAQFGIENFSKDNALLWELAHDFQVLKDTSRALMMYELAAKHSKGPRVPPPSADSLRLPTRCDWIPLSEYYEILELRKRIDTLIPPRRVLVNMGKNINSPEPDYAPFMHPSDSVLVFTSRRGAEKEVDYIFTKDNEELYFSIKDHRTGRWGPAEAMGPEINTTKYNEGSACISPNGKQLYFTRCHEEKGLGDCDIYHADWGQSGKWENVKGYNARINSAEWDSQPNVSPDGQMLFFSSNRRGGFGGTDIYYCLRENDTTWSPAYNMGPVVNTPENEITPFYNQINKTLYFASTGQLRGYGNYDIYKSSWTGLQWDEPQNLGPLINTPGSEYYFSINGAGNKIYYAKADVKDRDGDEQDFDLYSFTMPMEARPDATYKLSGYLIDSLTKKPLVGRVVVVDLDEGVEIAPKRINENGYFEFNLRPKNSYRIYVVGDNYLTIRNDMSIKNKDTTFNVFTESFKEDRPLIFESLEFSENSAELAFSAKPKLDYLTKFMQRYPMFIVVIKGHTDSDGTEEYNKDLSKRRATQIKNYITKEGNIDPLRLIAEGYGESRPLVPNDNEENKRKNRRVEFELRKDPRYTGPMLLPTPEETRWDDEYMTEENDAIMSEDFTPEDFFEEFNLEDWEDKELDEDAAFEKELEGDLRKEEEALENDATKEDIPKK